VNVCFITAGPMEWASSRIRAYWVAEQMDGAQVITYDNAQRNGLPAAGAYIWQKRADVALIQQAASARHFWDVCDPSWWWAPALCREIAAAVDGVVAATDALARDFYDWSGISPRVIRDRIKAEAYPIKRQHTDGGPVRFIWYGVALNRVALAAGTHFLERLVANGYPIELTVMDNQPEQVLHSPYFPIYHTRWSLARENAVIAAHDIAILPPYPGPHGPLKSNNKKLVAWACGVPTTEGEHYPHLERLVQSAEARARSAKTAAFAPTMAGDYEPGRSARQWEAVVCAS
jgi:hypothetical protein